MGEFAEAYSQMTDDQLLGLYLERDQLVPEALPALLAELQNRSLTESDASAVAKHMAAVEGTRKRKSGEDEKLRLTDVVDTDAEEVSPPPLEVVFGSADASEAQVVQGLLESNAFQVTVRHGGRTFGGMASLGGVNLLVAAERADEARRLIGESRRGSHEAAVEGETPIEQATKAQMPETEVAGQLVTQDLNEDESLDIAESVPEELTSTDRINLDQPYAELPSEIPPVGNRRILANPWEVVPASTLVVVLLSLAVALLAPFARDLFEGGLWSYLDGTIVVFYLAAVGTCLIIPAWVGRLLVREHHILRIGMPVKARITSVEEPSGGNGHSDPGSINYEYKDPWGQLREGRTDYFEERRGLLTVLVDPGNPKRHVVLRRSYYRILKDPHWGT